MEAVNWHYTTSLCGHFYAQNMQVVVLQYAYFKVFQAFRSDLKYIQIQGKH